MRGTTGQLARKSGGGSPSRARFPGWRNNGNSPTYPSFSETCPRAGSRTEARLQRPEGSKPQAHPGHPRWKGEPFAGRTLLVDWEQGLGDTLMFVRYAPQVHALGGRVLWSVQPSLAEVIATCPGVDEVIPMGAPLPPFDFHVPLLSLPSVFRTDLASIPAEIPYLQGTGPCTQPPAPLRGSGGFSGKDPHRAGLGGQSRACQRQGTLHADGGS